MQSLKKLYQCTDPSPPSKSGWILPAPQIDPPDISDNADTTPGRPRTSKPQLDSPNGAYTMRSLKKLYQRTYPSPPSKSGWVLPAPQTDPPDISDNADTTPGRPRTSKPQLDPPDVVHTMRSLKKLYHHLHHPRADGYCQHRTSSLQTSLTMRILLPGDLGLPNRNWIHLTVPTPCGH